MPTVRRYAARTKVSIAQSRAEIERSLERFGANGFGFAVQARRAQVYFEASDRRIRFELPAPNEFNEAANVAEERRLWRSLAQAIKSKLDTVRSGITTFETEFLPYTLLADGRTFADAAADPKFVDSLSASNLAPLIALPTAKRA